MQSFQTGFKLADGFDLALHQNLSLLVVGCPADDAAKTKIAMEQEGFEIIGNYSETVLNNGVVSDWVFIEAVAKAINSDVRNLVERLSRTTYTMTLVDFGMQVGGKVKTRHFCTTNYVGDFSAVDGRLPFGICSTNPDPYTFMGLTGMSLPYRRYQVVSVHTSPELTVFDNTYSVGEIKLRTAAVCYLSPLTDGTWAYGLTGADMICLAVCPDLKSAQEGWVVDGECVNHLLGMAPGTQFAVALIARKWRNVHGSMSAEIFQSIVMDHVLMAARLGFDYLPIVEYHFNRP